MPDSPTRGWPRLPAPNPAGAVTTSLLITLAVLNAVPPLATDMYTPAFPNVTADLGTTATMIGLTLTAFFVGFGPGQIVGGAVSDSRGRRGPVILGTLTCLAGGVLCALAPNVWVLILGRFIQGFGGGMASATGRAVLVDLAHGVTLAKTMSILMAIGGLAPMIAPVLGGLMITHWPWEAIFWALAAFAALMAVLAWFFVPESLPPDRRHDGGLRRLVGGIGTVLANPVFVGYLFTSAFSSFCMFGYIANSSYVLQGMKGLAPLTFSLIFAGNALLSTAAALLNSRLVGRIAPRRLIRLGLTVSALSVVILAVSVFAFDTNLIGVCVGFATLMAVQGFIFGNSSALALGASRAQAGTASAVMGLIQSLMNALSAPLATLGGATSATPMVIVMIVGVCGAWLSFTLVGRAEISDAPPRDATR